MQAFARGKKTPKDRKGLLPALVTVVVYEVPVIVLDARGLLQSVAALQAVDQVALDDPWASKNLRILD